MRPILALTKLCFTAGLGYALDWAYADPSPEWAEIAPAVWSAGGIPDLASLFSSLHLGSEAQAALPQTSLEAMAEDGAADGRAAPPYERLGMTAAALALTQAAEPLRLEAERDEEGLWVIGYGRRLAERPSSAVTPELAEQMLREDIAAAQQAVRGSIQIPLNANEFGALVEFARSIGPENFPNTLVPTLLNAGDREAAADAFQIWSTVRVDGGLVESADLATQRQRTRDLFLTPVADAPGAVALNP